MTNLRQICASVVLCVALGVTAFAGEMDTAGKPASTTSEKGAVSTTSRSGGTYDALAEAVLLFGHKLLFLL